MLSIRFFRTGKKNQPFFRIVVTDKKNPPRGGKFLEILGFYNPLTKEKKVKKERIEHWLKNGAQPSDRVYNLLIREGIIKGKKKPVHSKKPSKKQVKEKKQSEQQSEPQIESQLKPQPEEKQEQEDKISNS